MLIRYHENWGVGHMAVFNIIIPEEFRCDVKGVYQKLMAGDIEPVE